MLGRPLSCFKEVSTPHKAKEKNECKTQSTSSLFDTHLKTYRLQIQNSKLQDEKSCNKRKTSKTD